MSKYFKILFLFLFITVKLYSNKYFIAISETENKLSSLSEKFNINSEAFNLALKGYEKLKSLGLISNVQFLTIVDFSKPSNIERFYVIDMLTKQLIIKTLVAHGKNSGALFANNFSNKNASLKSSLGFYITRSPYIGKHGTSLELEGLELGINDQVKSRAIVIHGANYVSNKMAKESGIIGRSFGCPAVPINKVKEIVTTIQGGSCMFIYAPNNAYLEKSQLAK